MIVIARSDLPVARQPARHTRRTSPESARAAHTAHVNRSQPARRVAVDTAAYGSYAHASHEVVPRANENRQVVRLAFGERLGQELTDHLHQLLRGKRLAQEARAIGQGADVLR